MPYFPDPDRPVEAILHAAGFRRTLPLRSAPRDWAHGPTIAISRQVGARGTTIARAVGARLGWRVYDHELLDRVAQEMNVGPSALEALDERGSSWLQEWLESLGGRRFNAGSYAQHLVHTLFVLARPGYCVIVGRGAAQVLPGATTLRVRLVATLKDRLRTISEELGMAPAMARRYVERKEQERFRFVREHFHCDPTDPLQYDLTLNTSRFSVDECADFVVAALCVRHPQVSGTGPAASAAGEATASA
jgi:cytidylate kinase